VEVIFRHAELERLELDVGFDGAHGVEVVRAFRKLMQYIRAAVDERDFYARKSLHYEKLLGAKAHYRSMRLNQKWRLIVAIERERDAKTVAIIRIENYH